MQNEPTFELFFPYYINQARLLDLYAILNGGYAEYEEISSSSESSNKKSGSAKVDGFGGFKIFKIGGSLAGSIEGASSDQSSSNARVVQTTTSMLGLVASTLSQKGYVREIKDAEVGSFVVVPVILKINSIKALINEACELLELSEKMKSIGNSQSSKGKNNTIAQMEKISNVVRELFGSEEIVYETNDFALIGSISDEHLYQATRADIIGTELKCLAQVKKVFPEGTQLLKNTVFTKIQDAESKVALIDSLRTMLKGSNFEFESDAIVEIANKPVFQLEIVALYQSSKPK